jgi:hypothetical protein
MISRTTQLCSHLSQGIHAVAQPLAILLASLSKEHTAGMGIDELRELTASSAVEVQRVCALFGSLQQLVMTESIQPELSSTPILPLLAYVVDGVKLLFEQDGMYLNSLFPASCDPVLIHRGRTLQALTRVLLIAHAFSRTGDTIELIASSSSEAMQVVVRNLTASTAAIRPEVILSMAVAEANMRSQRAGFSWSPQPFHVQIELHR